MNKNFSQACVNNSQPILSQLSRLLSKTRHVLEIGSGTGQHAAYFAPSLPQLTWHTSDVSQNHDSIGQWIDEAGADNIMAPVSFKVGDDEWPIAGVDGVFSANTAHIMQPFEVQLMMGMIGKNLAPGGVFCQYGPFKINGQYTGDSNREFDLHLAREGCGGIRDIQELVDWEKGLILSEQITMPANNLLLVWRKLAF
jgi:cyclopropane fatty-acyl-phospholipid synthase-like methyltransferase